MISTTYFQVDWVKKSLFKSMFVFGLMFEYWRSLASLVDYDIQWFYALLNSICIVFSKAFVLIFMKVFFRYLFGCAGSLLQQVGSSSLTRNWTQLPALGGQSLVACQYISIKLKEKIKIKTFLKKQYICIKRKMWQNVNIWWTRWRVLMYLLFSSFNFSMKKGIKRKHRYLGCQGCKSSSS